MALKVDYLQAGTYTAKDDRYAEGIGLISTGGVTWRSGVLQGDGTELAVTANGTPNMTVNVAAGQGICPCSGDATSAPYIVTSDAVTNLGIATANATNPRKDLVCLTVRDAFYSGANNDAILQVITGTAAPTPTLPATPINSIALAEVDVAANATSITSGNIIDLRSFTTGRGGTLVCTSGTHPSPAYKGMIAFESDTKNVIVYDGTSWIPMPMGAWTSYTPVITQNGARTATIGYAKYTQTGKTVSGSVALTITNAGTAGFSIAISLPVTPVFGGSPAVVIGAFSYIAAGARYAGSVLWAGAGFGGVVFQVSGSLNVLGVAPSFAVANTDQISFDFNYEVA